MTTADLTVRDVADVLATSPETVRSLISSGALSAYRLSGARGPWRVTPDALDAYRTAQTKRDPWARTRPRRTA